MKNFECRIQNINTYYQTEDDGDEIFLKLKKKKIWPEEEKYFKLTGSQPVKIDYAIPLQKLEGKIEIELWEYDNIISSKHIGTFLLSPTEIGGPFSTDLKLTSKEFARYTLVWEVVPKVPKI